MWGVRRQVSLLLDHGHPRAQFYPLRRVWEEATLVTERLNGLEKTRAILTNKAVSAVISKKAAGDFKKLLDGMGD